MSYTGYCCECTKELKPESGTIYYSTHGYMCLKCYSNLTEGQKKELKARLVK